MNPNSQNQVWGRWEFAFFPGRKATHPDFKVVKDAAAIKGRQVFGQAAAMHVDFKYDTGQKASFWEIGIRAEGTPVHDPDFVTFVTNQWEAWGLVSFGPGTRMEVREAKLEAGDRQDGTPRDQMIIVGPLESQTKVWTH
jgi:hypothetical protein